jgi:dGTPase
MNMGEPVGGLLTIEQRESRLLAPYALASSESRGRRHAEPEHPYRGPFQRDRDRILHSSAFRRLSGKMQVFTGDRGDYHRTRLTHTFEVASIARTIGRTLRLNEDLVEALALFHDIGHPPFGHAGEDALHECLADVGGFSHNRYALTLAEELEQRQHPFPGLNLTWEVLEGQATRLPEARESEGHSTGTERGKLLEVQIVDLADSITYDAHDADDAIKLGLVSLEELLQIPLVQMAVEQLPVQETALEGSVLRKAVIHRLIDYQVSSLLEVAGQVLSSRKLASSAEARKFPPLEPSREMAERKRELEAFLYERVYRHPELIRVREMARQRLVTLFEAFLRNPSRLPERFRQRAEQVGLARSVGDYLAGMTDRFCNQQYEQLGPSGPSP